MNVKDSPLEFVPILTEAVEVRYTEVSTTTELLNLTGALALSGLFHGIRLWPGAVPTTGLETSLPI